MSTSRRKRVSSVWLATALYLLVSSSAFAKVSFGFPELNPPGKFIRPTITSDQVPEGVTPKIVATPSANAEIYNAGKGGYLLTAKENQWASLSAAVLWVVDGEPFYDAGEVRFAIGDKRPDDVVPPGPVPVPKTLRELVDEPTAAILSEFYRDLAEAARAEKPTAEKFLAAHTKYFKELKLPANAELDAALDKELQKAVADLATLPASLDAIADQFGKPKPPGPGPQPTPAPIPESGLHVLIVEETDDRGTLPANQLGVLQTTEIRSYVNSRGGEFRQYDDDPEIADPKWRAARNRPRTVLPWLIISNGTTGHEGPIGSMSVAEVLALIRKYE